MNYGKSHLTGQMVHEDHAHGSYEDSMNDTHVLVEQSFPPYNRAC